jgi:hypothetical protein
VKAIIREVHSHTLTVVLAALSLSAGGMDADTLLHELKSCGLNISDGENVELYKDGDYTEGLMMQHLRRLLQLGQLSGSQLDILRNLSLLPDSGVLKNRFKNESACYLLFLQDLFPYLEKYLVTDHMPALVERMEYVMQKYDINTPCDKALLLDYKAELFI